MNRLKINFIWRLLVILLGCGLVAFGIFKNNDFAISFGTLMTVIIILKMIRLYFRIRTPEAKKKYLEKMNDERYKTIAGLSGIVAYTTLELILFGVFVYALLNDINVLMLPISLIMCAGLLGYLITYIIYDKKY